ncbi:MAG: hypothetical protein ACXAAT_17990 [Candidatus Hodarchaeales archaeon]|jgi:hypothetical protein
MKKYRNAKGQFVAIGKIFGVKESVDFKEMISKELFPYITKLFTEDTTKNAIKRFQEFASPSLSLYEVQKILSIHPYFKDRL